MGVQPAFVVDPRVLFLGPNIAAARELYDSLVGKDAGAHCTPALATAWKQTDDRTWEFSLRQGVRFNEGAPFSADDVIAFPDRRRIWRDTAERVARLAGGLRRQPVRQGHLHSGVAHPRFPGRWHDRAGTARRVPATHTRRPKD